MVLGNDFWRNDQVILSNYKERTILDSNCVEFWAAVDDRFVSNVTPNRYWISTFGNTWNSMTGKPIGLSMHRKGYKQFSMMTLDHKQVTRKLHRLIMYTFCYFPGCEKFEVNHIDGNKLNNNITNLEWCTSSENTIHAINNGLKTVFGNEYTVTLTDEDVANILALKDIMEINDIWRMYYRDRGVSLEAVQNIVAGRGRLGYVHKEDRYNGLA